MWGNGMCGRFVMTLPTDAMAALFDAAPANDLPDSPNFNVCPTMDVHAVHVIEGRRRLVPMRWGFLPSWYKAPNAGPLLINARAETLAEKPAFKTACRTRRCVIPATGFYEWTKDQDGKRLPWYISRADGQPLMFAAVWQDWAAGDLVFRTCAMVTTAANEQMARIHHRMPVILQPSDLSLWLGEAGHGAARLMRAAPENALVWHRVALAVNSNRATGPDLIQPMSLD